jgi:tetratricopeptide (TPR) repeat protein
LADQFSEGDYAVQIQGAAHSSVAVTYVINGVPVSVPLERAKLPPPTGTASPALLTRARSAVVPFAARQGLRDELGEWLDSDPAFSVAVIGGAGGTGKTRLAVELCEQAESEGWLTGLLTKIEDLASYEALADAPIARLVAVDYAESRAAQMEVLLQLLAARATPEHPVRVLLLMRAGPRRTNDWTEALRNQSDQLENILEECETRVLDEAPLNADERVELFDAAAGVFSAGDPPPAPADLRESDAFARPLLVVLAAYLEAKGEEAPSAREPLLRSVLAHEERYWRSRSGSLFEDDEQPRRVIALATLLGADNETGAIGLLPLLPDFSDVSSERLTLIARWVASLYPGNHWWNPLEPDLIGEQLVADELSDQPSVLAGALAGSTPAKLIRPLEVLGRAAADHLGLAVALKPILDQRLVGLCAVAAAQAGAGVDGDLLYGRAASVAALLEKVVTGTEPDRDALLGTFRFMPLRFDLMLGSLALALNQALVEHDRRLAREHPDSPSSQLAGSLNDLSIRLSDMGYQEEALEISAEVVEIRRLLVELEPDLGIPDMAGALNNLSNRFSDVGRTKEALPPIEEAVGIYRRIVDLDAEHLEGYLAASLNNLSNRLAEAGRYDEALAPIEEAVEIRRRLAAADPATYEADLAGSLSNFCVHLAVAGYKQQALAPIQEAVALYRRLAAARPTAYQQTLAGSLNNLSNRLSEAGQHAEALGPIEEAVEIRRHLATVNPLAFGSDLAASLGNLSNRLGEAGHREEALAPVAEAVEIRRRLAAANPRAFEPHLATSLNNFSNCLADAKREEEALERIEEAVEIRRRLAAANPLAFEADLAKSMINFANVLGDLGRREEAAEVIHEAIGIYRPLAEENPTTFGPNLAIALNNLSVNLTTADTADEALAPIEEAVEIRRRLALDRSNVSESRLAMTLHSFSSYFVTIGRPEDAAPQIEEAVKIYRRLAVADPRGFRAESVAALRFLGRLLLTLDRTEEAEAVAEAVAEEAAGLEGSD